MVTSIDNKSLSRAPPILIDAAEKVAAAITAKLMGRRCNANVTSEEMEMSANYSEVEVEVLRRTTVRLLVAAEVVANSMASKLFCGSFSK